MAYFDLPRIQGYCASCEKYGLYWSCPPYATQPIDVLGDWSHAVLVTQKTRVPVGSTPDSLISFFLHARQSLCERIHALERAGAVGVVPGYCDGCKTCTRSRNMACCKPASLRYSLEALGFDVTGLAEGLAGQKMHWPDSGVPDYLIMVGALLCATPEIAQQTWASSSL